MAELVTHTFRLEWPFLTRIDHFFSREREIALRPALVLILAAKLGRCEDGEMTRLAAAVELAALASLAQVSVPDEPSGSARTRPNWGTRFAVLAADVMLARALALCVGGPARLSEEVTGLVERMCAGQIRQLRLARSGTLPTPEQSLALLSSSGLGAVYRGACELGARAARLPANAVAGAARLGGALGASIQLLDDLARLTGGTDVLGRDARADLQESVPAYPLVVAMAAGPEPAGRIRGLLDDPSSPHAAAELVEAVQDSGADEAVRARILLLMDEARATALGLPEGPARDSLLGIAAHIAERAAPDIARTR